MTAGAISDEEMDRRLATVRPYVTIFLKRGPAYVPPANRSADRARIVREHGRRNMQFKAEGRMAIVGPIGGGGDIVGLYIFAAPEAEAREIMEGDGAVRAKIFTYDVVTLYGFPGEALPPLSA